MTPNILLQLKNWIDHNADFLKITSHFKKIKRRIADDTGIPIKTISEKDVYDLLHPGVQRCSSMNFVSFSIGYRTCKKGCPCYVQQVSRAVSKSKSLATPEDRARIADKRKQTNISRYGVENQSQLPEIVDKIKTSLINRTEDQRAQTIIKTKTTTRVRYGVDNVMQNPQIRDRNHADRDYKSAAEKAANSKLNKYGVKGYNNIAKIKKTLLERYGVDNPSHLTTIRQQISKSLRAKYVVRHQTTYAMTPLFDESEYKVLTKQPWMCKKCGSVIQGYPHNGQFTRCTTCNPYTVSSIELELREFLTDNGIAFVTNKRDIIPPKELDIYMPAYNLAIEMCGTYWHRESVGKTRSYHVNKLNKCHNNGIRLLTLFSDQWETRKDIVKSRILTLIHQTRYKTFARKCKVAVIPHNVATQFMEDNHCQRSVKSAYSYGLTDHMGNLVAVMQFSKSRFEVDVFEMTRYAVLPHWVVIGGASKLFAYFVDSVNPATVVSYSDNCWGYTEFYGRLGFTKISNGSPGYSYIYLNTPAVRINRMRFQKHKLKNMIATYDPTMTEYQNMQLAGYDRVWDCGHTKWVWCAK